MTDRPVVRGRGVGRRGWLDELEPETPIHTQTEREIKAGSANHIAGIHRSTPSVVNESAPTGHPAMAPSNVPVKAATASRASVAAVFGSIPGLLMRSCST